MPGEVRPEAAGTEAGGEAGTEAGTSAAWNRFPPIEGFFGDAGIHGAPYMPPAPQASQFVKDASGSNLP